MKMMSAERAGSDAWIRARLALRVVRTEEVEGGEEEGREGSEAGVFLAECPERGEGRRRRENGQNERRGGRDGEERVVRTSKVLRKGGQSTKGEVVLSGVFDQRVDDLITEREERSKSASGLRKRYQKSVRERFTSSSFLQSPHVVSS